MWGELALPLACGLVIAASGRFRPGIAQDRALALAIIAAAVFMMAELASGLSLRIMLDIGKQMSFIFNRPALTCLVLSAAVLPALLNRPATPLRDRMLGVLAVLAVGALTFDSESGAAGLGLLIMVAVWLPALVGAAPGAIGVVALGFAATMALAPVLGRLGDTALPPAVHERLANSHSRERVDIWLSFGEAILARPLLGSGFGTSADTGPAPRRRARSRRRAA